MVEGHSVHRVCHRIRAQFLNNAYKASSPNKRFTEGAHAIDGRKLSRVEVKVLNIGRQDHTVTSQAIGKNLLVFFGGESYDNQQADVVHIHFGMAGAWSVYDAGKAPEATATTRHSYHADASNVTRCSCRLRLEGHGVVAHLSAMTVALGTPELFLLKKRHAWNTLTVPLPVVLTITRPLFEGNWGKIPFEKMHSRSYYGTR